jgi:hypothetical protein
MTRKEFQQRVDFNLVLNEWAAAQPGYKSPVTIADVEEVVAKVRPILKQPKHKISDLRKLKYFVLVKAIESSPPQEPFVMPEDPVKKMTANMAAEVERILVEQNLMRPLSAPHSSAARFEVTEEGRCFVTHYEQEDNTKK